MLPAGVAELADQLGPAIEAMGFAGPSVAADLARARLDGAPGKAAGHGIPKRLQIAHPAPPWVIRLGGAKAAC